MEKCCKDPSLSDSGLFNDAWLLPFAGIIKNRLDKAIKDADRIKSAHPDGWAQFADYHKFFGLHKTREAWIFREWAPNASEVFVLCPANNWQKDPDWALKKKENGIFEGRFPLSCFSHEQLFRLKMIWPGNEGDRIPSAATRVVQDPSTLIFNAQVWQPEKPYEWQVKTFIPPDGPLLIYEAHVGMALEEGRVGTYKEFADYILPKIDHAGYNTLQLMAIQEHPYYGSFGYHVSSFFSPASRFGTPHDLKYLIDRAHDKGIRVLMDMVHSHGVKNEVEGLSRFDGTLYQFFHDNERGTHRLWDSRCFDYSKQMVKKFLLSNLRYFIEEFKVDGFRFDGITSMLFEDHGLGRAFTRYDDYFGSDVDEEALSYLYTANQVVHHFNPQAVTIAEDVSGYPGLAASQDSGGTGFDFRFAMGIADFWIRLLKDFKDEDWPLGKLWHELTNHRQEEKTISYVECHDQALVGDKTVMMHLMGGHIYTAMEKSNNSIETFRAVALHKMIRLITLCTAHQGYLNFMGNEFGHPEWIDFPSQQNGFSFKYARRLWSLKYNTQLYYSDLFEFDRQMVAFAKKYDLFSSKHPNLCCIHEDDKVIAFVRKGMVFVFNFHPENSYADYPIDAPPGKYRMILDTDEKRFGGTHRLEKDQMHFTGSMGTGTQNRRCLSLYLPSRAALVLKPDPLAE